MAGAKTKKAAETPHHVSIGQMAAAGMAAAPSNDYGNMNNAHLHQTIGTPTPATAPTKGRRG